MYENAVLRHKEGQAVLAAEQAKRKVRKRVLTPKMSTRSD